MFPKSFQVDSAQWGCQIVKPIKKNLPPKNKKEKINAFYKQKLFLGDFNPNYLLFKIHFIITFHVKTSDCCRSTSLFPVSNTLNIILSKRVDTSVRNFFDFLWKFGISEGKKKAIT